MERDAPLVTLLLLPVDPPPLAALLLLLLLLELAGDGLRFSAEKSAAISWSSSLELEPMVGSPCTLVHPHHAPGCSRAGRASRPKSRRWACPT